MNILNIKPGDSVVTDFVFYQHYSIVSDSVDKMGKFKLISSTKRNRTVKEENWDIVTQGRPTSIVEIKSKYPAQEVVFNAKSQIDIWSYSVLSNNCEHFVNWVNGLEVTSSQVKSGIAGGVVGCALVKMFSEEPSVPKYLGAALLVGGGALLLTRAIEKK